MTDAAIPSPLNGEDLAFIVDRVNVGVLVVDPALTVLCWNRFLQTNSGVAAEAIVGKKLYDVIEDVPRAWLERKVKSVVVLNSPAFSSSRQRPFLFRFRHHRPVTGGAEHMYQDLTFTPLRGPSGDVRLICITLFDVTDAFIYEQQLKTALAQVETMSRRDGLTQIFNRRYLSERLVEECARSRRYGQPLTAVLFDVDHFKRVNDTHGHLGGDEVLVEIAKRVTSAIRQTDIFARYGGEEFCLLLPSTPLDGAVLLAERLREAVGGRPVQFHDVAIPVTISLGVCEWTRAHERPEDLLGHADSALYASKKGGRNRVTWHPPAEAATG